MNNISVAEFLGSNIIKSKHNTQKKFEVSTKRLRKMCKYFKDKKVKICYTHKGSMFDEWDETYVGKYDDFNIRKANGCGFDWFEVRFFKKDKIVFTYECESYADEFVGLGAINVDYEPLTCYFRINRVK